MPGEAEHIQSSTADIGYIEFRKPRTACETEYIQS